jgi:cyclase
MIGGDAYIEPLSVQRPRVIVALTMLDGRLVRTRRFRNPTYVGDPINAVSIFSEKGADEIALLEVSGRPFDRRRELMIRDIAAESLVPISYGGGVSTLQEFRCVIRCGFEKVILNSALHDNLDLATHAASEFGAQAVVGSIEVATTWLRGRHVRTRCGRRASGVPLAEWAQRCERAGCGELLLTSIDADGSMAGYDLEMVSAVAAAVSIPVIALGGAGSRDHLARAVESGASAVAAGSMFVFRGPRRAVLLTYPEAPLSILGA